MGFIYFQDIDGEYSIINLKHLVFVDFKGNKAHIQMNSKGYSSSVKGEIYYADDFEMAYEGVKMLKENI